MIKGDSSVAWKSSAFDNSIANVLRIREERGQTMAEYAVILTVITAAVVLAVGTLSTSIGSHITDIANLFK